MSSLQLYSGLCAATLIVALGSLLVGDAPLSVSQAWAGLIGTGDSMAVSIMQEIRLPRTLLGLLVGGSLGMAGALLQGFLRNPLAEPGLLGVTNGAALGAVLSIYGGAVGFLALSLPLAAMAGAVLAVVLAYALAGRTGNSHTLILAGIAVSSLFGACVAVALNLAPNPFAAMDIMFWLMGSLANHTMQQVGMTAPFVLLGWAIMLSCARGLNALTLGEATATTLGVSLTSLTWRMVASVALAVGAGISVTGSIGFIGLVVPHILRPMVGHMPGRLLGVSAFGGTILLLLADILVRLIPTSGMELRVGVVTSLIGAPFFLALLIQQRRGRL